MHTDCHYLELARETKTCSRKLEFEKASSKILRKILQGKRGSFRSIKGLEEARIYCILEFVCLEPLLGIPYYRKLTLHEINANL